VKNTSDWVLKCLLAPLAAMPRRFRLRLLQLFVEREELKGRPEEALRFLLSAHDTLERAVDRAAVNWGRGIHPKHRLTGYHEFFVQHVRSGDRVLDVGCGVGEVASDVASKVEGVDVTGIDMSADCVAAAKSRHRAPNLHFLCGEAHRSLPDGSFDVAILSNVMEHMDDRATFLRRLVQQTGAMRLLIRVPLFERHWVAPLRRELGLPYFSDPTHRIEYTRESLREELGRAELSIVEEEYRWGEPWVVAVPGKEAVRG
jgi:SAM-dependent methyltransferase